jgi:hypothetical protein
MKVQLPRGSVELAGVRIGGLLAHRFQACFLRFKQPVDLLN